MMLQIVFKNHRSELGVINNWGAKFFYARLAERDPCNWVPENCLRKYWWLRNVHSETINSHTDISWPRSGQTHSPKTSKGSGRLEQ